MSECRLCQYGVETFDRRGYRAIRCEALKHGVKPWWYREDVDPSLRTPIFTYLATPECKAWAKGIRFMTKEEPK